MDPRRTFELAIAGGPEPAAELYRLLGLQVGEYYRFAAGGGGAGGCIAAHDRRRRGRVPYATSARCSSGLALVVSTKRLADGRLHTGVAAASMARLHAALAKFSGGGADPPRPS